MVHDPSASCGPVPAVRSVPVVGAPDGDILTRDECLGLLATVPVGRIGLSVDALPVIVPVGFCVLGDRVVFGVHAESRAMASLHGTVVAFQADLWDPRERTGWSVLVQGPARLVTDPVEIEFVQATPSSDWWMNDVGDDVHVVALGTDVITGHRLRGPARVTVASSTGRESNAVVGAVAH